MGINTELIRIGATIAGELAGAIIDAIARGDDIEPIVSSLPPAAQVRARRALEKEETRRALEAIRRDVLGSAQDE